MKISHLLIAIPVFVLLSVSVTLDLGTLTQAYPRYDSTYYLAARSLAKDLDFNCAPADSDRFFREWEARPSGFRIADRRVLFANGEFRTYPVFYVPDLFVYILVPFAGLLGYHGWMLFHALLILGVYAIGFRYYSSDKNENSSLPALNSVLYYTLFPLPVLFLLPTHHLYLFALITSALYLGLRGKPVVSAILLALAFSTQPWVLLVGVLLIGYWQYSGLKSEFLRFVPVLAVSVAAVWGLEFLMYPGPDVANVRWINEALDSSRAALHSAIPVREITWLARPSLIRLSDFIFGRNIGFVAYGTVAVCAVLSSIWQWRDRLVNRTLLFVILLLVAVSCTTPDSWNIYGFINDFTILLAATVFFAIPIARPRRTLVAVFIISAFFAAPLLVNPLGAWTSRNYYLQAFPFRYLPVELSIVGKYGITADPAFQFPLANGKLYFLNENFYPESEFFWVHGNSTLEFVVQLNDERTFPVFQLSAGPELNRITLELGGRREEFTLQQSGTATVSLSDVASRFQHYEGRYFLHGTIHSSSGFVPKLLSRENPDYRYLGCRVRMTNK